MHATRREFLRAGAFAAAGVGLAACSKKAPAGPKTLASIIAGRKQNVNVVSASDEILARADRWPFALFVPNTTNDHYTGGTAKVWIASDQGSAAMGPFDAAYHDDGLGARGVYSARIPFPKDGAWLVFAEAHPTHLIVNDVAQPTTLVVEGGTTVGVGRRSKQPIPGERAISVATPTVGDARGVKPICTSKPFCSMHDISLDAALKNGKPTVLIIATPRFCQSRTCGPVVDIVDDVKRSSPNVNFVHIEVYKDDTNAPAKGILAPAAAAWKLESEPATYFIAPDGTIAERFIGGADRAEMRAQVAALAG